MNDFLPCRSQYVKLNDIKSYVIITNTEVQEGHVLSYILFTLYRSDFRCHINYWQLLKHADFTALVTNCTNNGVIYREEVERFNT